MEEEIITCADCFHMGKAVYCMQCIRLGNGRKDMFVADKISPDVVAYYKKKYQNIEIPNQSKR